MATVHVPASLCRRALACVAAWTAAAGLSGCVEGQQRADADAGFVDASPAVDAGLARDAGTPVDAGGARDAGVEVADAGDALNDDAGVETSCDVATVDYSCVVGDAASCPGGQCWFGSCVGPVVASDRFASCGDGVCAGCDADAERETFCPADCADEPVIAARDLFDADVLTVFVHGIQLSLTPLLMAQTYGAAVDARGLGERLHALDATLADGLVSPTVPRQLVGVEYYGDTPDAALSADDVAWIEALPNDTPDALFRYARIVAVFVRDRMALTGARSVNLLCHSMGCAVTRALVELDLLGLSSSGALARVVGVSGALQGARMANMIDNPFVQEYAGQGAFNVWDIAALDPDHVQARVATWDHELQAADSPLWRGVLIHTLGGSDPTLDEAFNLFSLGAIHNPDDLPHDGVVFSFESLFARQDPQNQVVTASGALLAPTHGFVDVSHNEITEQDGTARIVHAGLFGRRIVFIRASSITLLVDEEAGGAPGAGDSELVFEQRVLLAGDVVDERKLDDRTPEMFTLAVGDTRTEPLLVFSGPIAMDAASVTLELSLVEVDRYRRYGLAESVLFEKSDPLLQTTVDIPLDAALQSGSLVLEGDGAVVTLSIEVVELAPAL